MRPVSFDVLLRRLSLSIPIGSIAVAAMLIGTPVAADPGPPAAARTAGAAETRESSLDPLFAALAAAPDDSSAAAIRARIESRWQASGSATADLLTTRAATAAHAGEPALALDLLDAAIVVAPTWAGGHHRRALLHLSRHDFPHARADIAATLAIEPRHFGAMAMMAALADADGRKKEALAWLRRIAGLDPRSPGLAGHIERLAIEVEGREL